MNNRHTSSQPPSGLPAQDIAQRRRQLARALAVGQFGWGLAGEINHIVERMHGTISRAPLPWQKLPRDRALGLSGLIYRLIGRSFGYLNHGFGAAAYALQQGDDVPDGHWLRFQAALNGVCGDKLMQDNSPLALQMSLQHRLPANPAGHHQIIFLHGLCMSELGWHNPAHEAFCDDAQNRLQANIQYLRYNTGRHISDNGAALSQLLQKQLQGSDRVSLIGHSMGGLLIRSALHAAQQAGHDWPQRLHLAVCLGSPHHGAPLERIGNHANRFLTLSPYLKPFSRLGGLRSAGIRDLRYGNIRQEDWRTLQAEDDTRDSRELTPLPAGPRYLLLAASLSPTVPEAVWQARHDYLVPVSSALGLSRQSDKQLHAPRLQRQIIAARNHLDLLSDAQVYQHITASMQG